MTQTHNITRKPHTAFITFDGGGGSGKQQITRTLFAVNFHSFVSFRLTKKECETRVLGSHQRDVHLLSFEQSAGERPRGE